MTRVAPRLSKSRRLPRPGHDGDEPGLERCERGRRTAALEETFLALRRLHVHVRDLDALDHAERGAECERLPGIVGVDVHLERRRVADDEERVADLARARSRARPCRGRRPRRRRPCSSGTPTAPGGSRRGRATPSRPALPGAPRPSRRRPCPRAISTRPGAPGVDDAGVAQDVEHLGRAREGILTSREHHPQEIVGTQAPMLLPLALLGHLADDGEHRPLDGALDSAVGGVARSSEGPAQK